MQETIKNINREYSTFYKSFLQQGKLPMKETPLGFWGYSIGDEIFELFQKIGLERYRSFIDLGSGDGKVVNIAALFTNAVGIESDRELIDKSEEVKKKFDLHRAKFIHGNFMTHDLSQYDLLYLYPDKRTHEIESKLINEMHGKLIVMGAHFHPLRLTKEQEFFVGSNPVAIYRR